MYDFKSERTENQNFTITTNTSQHVEFFHSLIFEYVTVCNGSLTFCWVRYMAFELGYNREITVADPGRGAEGVMPPPDMPCEKK